MCWSGDVVLTQFVSLTSGTSSGSAKVMSAHCSILLVTVSSLFSDAVTHVVESSTMLRKLDNLNSRVVADLRRVVCGQRYLWQAELAWVLLVRRSLNLEHWQHRMRVVQRLIAVAHVDVEHGKRMAREPSRLNRDGATLQRPLCAVL